MKSLHNTNRNLDVNLIKSRLDEKMKIFKTWNITLHNNNYLENANNNNIWNLKIKADFQNFICTKSIPHNTNKSIDYNEKAIFT